MDEKGIPSFPGVNYRMSEIAAAVGLAQVDRLPGILADLRRVKKNVIEQLGNLGDFRVVPSNDQDGDAGTTLTIQAPTREAAEQFREKTGWGALFDNTGTNWHIYYHWDYILEKRSASGTGFPWKVGDWESPVQYSKDMCPNAIDILSRSFSYGIKPDFTEAEISELVSSIRKGL
ncbi:MAG: 8-amino-3,8-dideoxy-alpha-D-manno-octulosonate transaminase [Syntrophomonadaceae bacterium]|nr:8-amino-3,8-dideoxy-alpha-D-manno-octulosonate transaminase [Bacillota bacterium]